ncbi:putative XRE-type DNA-binding protein [Caulobacter ginsengisoli]|uniref:XRE-type DNA-binding protein n=1 Tax=Caulobacter ginsengisoli TaxID=400775 RepID=A0ABU0ILS7_9CAUL|nr:XRE family transcriptional regulator [Caulobacter ginsengisoli]MDQ0462965.1 putative XRE-type DNA-binding protein [Caulobacter ginsengisoli]
MSEDPIEIVRGSGNVFRDLGMEDAELRQLKALLAAEIIKTLDGRALTVRAAAADTGIAAADFSRIRQVKLERFTVDRLMTILSRLGQEVKVQLSIRPRPDGQMRPALA